MKIEFSSKRREMLLLLFLTTRIVAVTSREIKQISHNL